MLISAIQGIDALSLATQGLGTAAAFGALEAELILTPMAADRGSAYSVFGDFQRIVVYFTVNEKSMESTSPSPAT